MSHIVLMDDVYTGILTSGLTRSNKLRADVDIIPQGLVQHAIRARGVSQLK